MTYKQAGIAQRFSLMSRRLSTKWHRGLLYKIKNRFPTDFYIIIRSYLLHKTFRVKYEEKEVTQLKEINSGVPQNSILGLVLYLIYTVDLPVTLVSTTATYANDSHTSSSQQSYRNLIMTTEKSS